MRDNFHTILIAKTILDLRNNLLIDLSQPEHFTIKIEFRLMNFLNSIILLSSACLASPLSRLSDDNPYL